MSLDLDPIRRRVEWMRDNEEQCRLTPGQVTLAGYAAAAIDCGKDVPALVAEVERLRAILTTAEVLSDAVEDLLFAEGDHRDAVKAAWQRYVEAADPRSGEAVRDA